MRPDDKQQFAEILQGVYVEVYQRDSLSKTALSIWWSAMASASIEEFRRAMSDWIRRPGRGQHPPRPADIIEMMTGTGKDAAISAWAEALWAMSRVGGYASVCFSDPLINLVIEQMGGWPKLCQTPEDELPFRANDFRAAYAALHGREVSHPAYLPGMTEISNHANGHRRPTTPILIGVGAQQVMESGRQIAAHTTTQAAAPVAAITAEKPTP